MVGASSFGSLLIATGGGGASGYEDADDSNYCSGYGGGAGSPNGKAGSSNSGSVNTGWALSFTQSSGNYGSGGYGAKYGGSGGTGGYNSQYVSVTTGQTYIITVGIGGAGTTAGNGWKASSGGSGFVLIAYGGDI